MSIRALIDFSYLSHRAFHAMNGLQYNDLDTAIIYGFFEQLRTVCFDPRIQTNDAHLFIDSRQSYRRRQFPAYKEKRRDSLTPEQIHQRERMHVQMDRLIDDALPRIGFPLYMQTGLESDDLIAKVCQTEQGKMVIVTADGDLYQCIRDGVAWFDPGRNLWLDWRGFLDKEGVTPDQWATVKALAGCQSDNVPGIPGVGKKSAIDFLRHKLTQGSRYDKIDCGAAIFNRNIELVRLPHYKTRPVPLRKPEYNVGAFISFCTRYGIQSYLEGSRRRQWEMFFAGDARARQTQKPRRRGEHG